MLGGDLLAMVAWLGLLSLVLLCYARLRQASCDWQCFALLLWSLLEWLSWAWIEKGRWCEARVGYSSGLWYTGFARLGRARQCRAWLGWAWVD
jgi:hypothetical protein